jgi:hypothetical protein
MEQIIFLTFHTFFQVKMNLIHESKEFSLGRIILSK